MIFGALRGRSSDLLLLTRVYWETVGLVVLVMVRSLPYSLTRFSRYEKQNSSKLYFVLLSVVPYFETYGLMKFLNIQIHATLTLSAPRLNKNHGSKSPSQH